MDSTHPSRFDRAAAMRPAGLGGGELLLPSRSGVGGEPFISAIVGRGIYAASLLRGAQDDRLAAFTTPCGGPQTGAAPVAGDGFDGRVSQTAVELQSLGAPAFSVFAQRVGHRAAQSSLEHRYHVHSVA